MFSLHDQHVRFKIACLLRYSMFAFCFSSVLLQAIEIVHGEHISSLTSRNHTERSNNTSGHHSPKLEIPRCISGGLYLKCLNDSRFESGFKASPIGNKVKDAVLSKLFEKYGQNEREISVEGLENLLINIRLINRGNGCEDASDVSERKTQHGFRNSDDHERSDDDRRADHARRRQRRRFTRRSVEGLVANSAGDSSLQSASDSGERGNSGNLRIQWNSDAAAKCLDVQHLLRLHGFNSGSLTTDDFLAICPSVVFLLDAADCPRRTPKNVRRSRRDLRSNEECVQLGCGSPLSHVHAGHLDMTNGTVVREWQLPPGSVWGYAIASCAVISAVGLVAVGIIPLMHKVFYNHLLQFLVALAIGSLAGDALLHLLPHALAPHNHKTTSDHLNESESIHRGSHGDDEERELKVIWLGLTSIGGIFLFFIVERLVGLYSEWRRIRKDHRPKPNPLVSSDVPLPTTIANPKCEEMRNVGMKLAQYPSTQSCEEKLMMVHSSKDVQKLANEAHEEMHKNCEPEASELRNSWDHSCNTGGHQHGHSIPGSVASVAWMVIIGDGFHNFADGIAVGSAYASNFSDGLSTSVAVFCHELPHELGDFAMLLNAGMSAKQALVYNCISSILCFIGMACGVAVGNIASSSQWIFALIAGMFLYIALVDMLPEMKSVDPKKGEHPLIHLGLQSAGMLLGIGVMVVIAVFEGRIRLD